MAETRFSGMIETGHGHLDLAGRMLVMGILNITPDSFSDGGRFAGTEAAVAQAERMLSEGADILDVGGESTRPGAEEIPAEEQMRRIVPVIERVRSGHPAAVVSVDTRSAAAAEAALDAGADILNDVSGLEHDPAMAGVAARRGAAVVLMHMKGTPKTMVQEARYGDVVGEVIEYFRRRVGELEAAGIERGRMILDPGIGFAKNTFHNLEIMRRLGEFHVLRLPVMVGPSRKRFIGNVLGVEKAEERLAGTLAAVAMCAAAGIRQPDLQPDLCWPPGHCTCYRGNIHMNQPPRLFHISDQPGIRLFEPRPAPHPSSGAQGLMVWAIDQDHVQNYLLPRDCPRITFFAGPDSTPSDVTTLLGPGGASHTVAIEACWLPRIQSQRLIRYEFDPGPFELHDATAGYWISRSPVAPTAETPIEDVLSELLQHDVELRIMRSLWKLREAVIHSSLSFSIIRMRNAQPPPEGLAAYYPLP